MEHEDSLPLPVALLLVLINFGMSIVAITRSIHQGLGQRFPRNDLTLAY